MDTVVWTVALMAAVGLVGSVLLLIVSRKLAIGEDERLTYLMSILPGVNCGACGHPGCEQYAKAMMNGAPPNACTTGGNRVAQALAAYLGVESTGVVQREAFVACQGSLDHIDPQLVFKGVPSCRVFSTLSYSSLSCPFGCLGYGDCAEACPFDAIVVENGVARIDTAACTGCGTCAKICPRGIISMVDQASSPTASVVTCKNTMAGAKTRKVCSVGCIGCQKCAKTCPTQSITVENNLARIDTDTCIGCGTCAIVCPYNAPKVDEEKKKAVRCNGCAERVAAGEKPVCVEACPARALDFGDAEEMAKMGERGNIAPLPDPSETTPNIFIKASADAQPVGAAEIANPLEVA